MEGEFDRDCEEQAGCPPGSMMTDFTPSPETHRFKITEDEPHLSTTQAPL